jgi:hypothetical protein
MNDLHEQVLSKLVQVARPCILQHYSVDSCIASTRIGIDVLAHFGFVAQPLTVRAIVYNPAFCRRIEAGALFPQTQKELSQWAKEDGSWNIGIGFGANADKWDAHLVFVSGNYVVDLALDQANRPKYQIKLNPTFFAVDSEFLTGQKPHVFWMNDCIIRVGVIKDYSDYRTSPDWVRPRKKIVQEIINKMEGII